MEPVETPAETETPSSASNANAAPAASEPAKYDGRKVTGQPITMGRTVGYRLNEGDCVRIKGRRQASSGQLEGNDVCAGQVFPAVCVAAFGDSKAEDPHVNLRVFLDGNDDYWALSRNEDALEDTPQSGDSGNEPRLRWSRPGTWHWLDRA